MDRGARPDYSEAMRREIVLTDPVFARRDADTRLDRLFDRILVDTRDRVFVHLMLKIACLVLPVALFLFLPGRFSWFVAVPYLAINWVFFLGPFVLMLHCTSHRRLFRKEHDWLNRIIPWILGPFFGETPETYFGHHLGMHHPENNLAGDLSSTMRYRRDSLLHFLAYFLRFFVFGLPEVVLYFRKKGRGKLLARTVLGELSWYAMVVLLARVNLEATLVVFVVPLVFARFAMMAGNWAQHAFIDPTDPGNCYRNSVTCINAAYNRKCFNDGYHIVHHLEPSMHYTDMPGEFLANRERYAREGSVVFEGIDFFFLWFLLMAKAYRAMACRFVQLGDSPSSEEEVVAFLKSRTAPIRA